MRVGRLPIVEWTPRQLMLMTAIRGHRPNIVPAVTITEVGDPLSVRRPHRLPGVVEEIGYALGRAASCRKSPDAALHIDGESLAVRRNSHRHGCPFADRDVDPGFNVLSSQGRGG